MKGITIIDNAVKMFTKVTKRLDKGISRCLKEVERKHQEIGYAEVTIAKARGVKAELMQQIARANMIKEKVAAIIE